VPQILNKVSLHLHTHFAFSPLLLQWKKILSATNQQQIDCLLKHIEHSQNLNLWSRQTEKSSGSFHKKQKRIQIITPNSSPPPPPPLTPHVVHLETIESTSSIIKNQPTSKKLEWVVLPVFVDIVKLALKAREDCSTR
jgi:hypothetical protein